MVRRAPVLGQGGGCARWKGEGGGGGGSNTGDPSQDAPAQTAHRTLEKLSCKHKACLARFCCMVTNSSQRLLGTFCSCQKGLLMVAIITGRVPRSTQSLHCTRAVARAPSVKAEMQITTTPSSQEGVVCHPG